MLGEIDPICILYEKQLKDSNNDGEGELDWYEQGRTEMIKNTENP